MIVWFLKVHIEQILSPLPKCEAKAKAEAKIHKFKQCIVQIFHEAIFQKNSVGTKNHIHLYTNLTTVFGLPL